MIYTHQEIQKQFKYYNLNQYFFHFLYSKNPKVIKIFYKRFIINEVKKSAFRELSEFQNKIVEKVHKDAITSLHLIYEEDTQSQKIVTTSMDGFIKMIDARDGQTKKAFFVCQSGINTSTALSSQDSFALAAQNHNIFVFSFLTGTTITNFYAHDDIINKVLFSNDKLISCSSDQTLRIWDLKGSNFSNPVILYDHEEEIVSAAVTQNILSSMDIEGTIITRDLRTQEIISTIRLDKQYETGQVLFNSKMKNELIVFYNNEIELYDISNGRLIQGKELDQNVTNAVQDEDCIVLSYDNGSVAVYDWNKDKILDESDDFGGMVKQLGVSQPKVSRDEKILATGNDKGELTILRKS